MVTIPGVEFAMFGLFNSRSASSQPVIEAVSAVSAPVENPLLVITHDAQRFFRLRESKAWNTEFARIAKLFFRLHASDMRNTGRTGAARSCYVRPGFIVMHGGMAFSNLWRTMRSTLTEYDLYDTFGNIVLHGRYDAGRGQDTTADIKIGPGPELHVLSNDYTQAFAEDFRLNHAVGSDNHYKPWLAAWEHFLYALTGVRIVDFRSTDATYLSPSGKLDVVHAPVVTKVLDVEAQRRKDALIDELVAASLARGPRNPFTAIAGMDFGTLVD